LIIVKPETVIDWHRQGFRWYWTWKVRHGRPGRPQVAKETRDLIRKMSRDNPLWGAPRIHGELLKLGIKISQASVAKYMVRHPLHSVGQVIAIPEVGGLHHRYERRAA
jgi:putative transposase